jgi:hypothetical protein
MINKKLIFVSAVAVFLLAACGKSQEERVKATFDCIQKNKWSGAKDIERTCAKENGATKEEMQEAAMKAATETPANWNKNPPIYHSVNPF